MKETRRQRALTPPVAPAQRDCTWLVAKFDFAMAEDAFGHSGRDTLERPVGTRPIKAGEGAVVTRKDAGEASCGNVWCSRRAIGGIKAMECAKAVGVERSGISTLWRTSGVAARESTALCMRQGPAALSQLN